MITFKKNNTTRIVRPWDDSINGKSNDWIKCTSCGTLIYHKQLKENLNVCPKCNFYFKMKAIDRIESLIDQDTFIEHSKDMKSIDILEFNDQKPYKKRLLDAENKTGINEAIVTGTGKIEGYDAAVGVMDFDFIGGSMGVVVGEKVFNLVENADKESLPLVIVSSSGGARMQEGMFSLIQMARTSGAICKFHNNNGLYISIFTNPTTGGVLASFSFLGDIIISEPGATIGFAGARVIDQTIKQKVQPKQQTSELFLNNGFIDKIVERKNIKKVVGRLLYFYELGKKRK